MFFFFIFFSVSCSSRTTRSKATIHSLFFSPSSWLVLLHSMACDNSLVYGAHSYGWPFSYDIISNRLQPTCIVCFSNRLILSVAFQSLVSQCSQMFRGGIYTGMYRPPFAHTPFQRFSAVMPFGSHFHLLRDCF